RARRFKHLFGGALRQAGIAAAGCLHALDHHVDRLADDHANARRLAEGLAEAGVATEAPDTNMVYFAPPDGWSPAAFLAAIEAEGVRMGPAGRRVRAVTHLDVDAAGIATAIEVVAGLVGDGGPGGDPGGGGTAR